MLAQPKIIVTGEMAKGLTGMADQARLILFNHAPFAPAIFSTALYQRLLDALLPAHYSAAL
jgi:hypothetical protein